jgi:hypothetical protein
MPRQLASSDAPVDLVPNCVRVDDCADAAPVVGSKQHGIADNRVARIAPDDHRPPRPERCRISATNNRPWLSTTSQEYGPRNCVVPSVCTMRRASVSEPMSPSRCPSLVVSIHMALLHTSFVTGADDCRPISSTGGLGRCPLRSAQIVMRRRVEVGCWPAEPAQAVCRIRSSHSSMFK